jgi:hypothetical protein
MVWRPMSVQRWGLRGGDQCIGFLGISANELTSGANLDHDSTPLFLAGNNVYGIFLHSCSDEGTHTKRLLAVSFSD